MPHRELTILLVEDSEDDVFFFKRIVARFGLPAHLHVAGDGAKAMGYLSKEDHVPDIIFLDLKMPNQNGFEVLDWLKKNPVLEKTRILILTSSTDPREREMALKMGAEAYFVKPLTGEQLSQVLAKS